MNKLFLFSEYLTQKYGKPLYRVPIDLPLSCPHRRSGSGKGCIFCPENGARARHLKNNLDLQEQVRQGINFVDKRYGASPPYIAYFQSFTNTYASVEKLKEYYEKVFALADFSVVIIATRPDCLPDRVLDYLSELNKRYELWIELGVQSAKEATLQLINRGHDFSCVEKAVKKLHEREIKAAAHVILGLPGETEKDYVYTSKKLSALPFSGIKLHNLLVLRKTPLATLYEKEKFTVMNEYEYADALVSFLQHIPKDWTIMRLTADAPHENIIAPKWLMNKGQFIEYIKSKIANNSQPGLPRKTTDDGSITLYHPEYRQHFHTVSGAASEAEQKFISPCKIEELLQRKSIRLLDIGFGLGYNTLAALSIAKKQEVNKLEIVSLEKDYETAYLSSGIHESNPNSLNVIESLLNNGTYSTANCNIELILGDARKTVLTLTPEFDVVFLDGFSPESNPELWSYDFIRVISSLMGKDAILATYSNAFPVKGALLRAGLNIYPTKPFGRKNGGIAASFAEVSNTERYSEKEINIVLKSTTGLAYRDPGLYRSRKEIIKNRKHIVDRLRSMGIPKWLKN